MIILLLWIAYTLTCMTVSGIIPITILWITLNHAWILTGITLPLSLATYYFTLLILLVIPGRLTFKKINVKKTKQPAKKFFEELYKNPYAMIYMYSYETAMRMIFFVHQLIMPLNTYLYKLLGAKIGKNTVVYGKLFDSARLTIGNNTVIGHDAIISAHLYNGKEWVMGPVRIGNDCLIGGRALIGPNVVIEDDCVIAAGSVIASNKRIRKGTVYIPGKT